MPKRPDISPAVALHVWTAAGGRCAFCHTYVLGNDALGLAVRIGELAHIVGWSPGSPRGDDPLPLKDRQKADNLIFACRNCHRPVDDGGVVDLYSISQLRKLKTEHETHMKYLTSLSPDRSALVVRVVSAIRGAQPELTRDTILEAVTLDGYYPTILSTSHWNGVEVDLRILGELDDRNDFERCIPAIKELAARIHDGVRTDAVERLAIFGFARIALLVALGAALDDKVDAAIFQRHRGAVANPWAWPSSSRPVADLETTVLSRGPENGRVAVIVSLSGSIAMEDLPDGITDTHTVYRIQPSDSSRIGIDIVDSVEALNSVERELRRLLAALEATHGSVEAVDLFPAVGVATGVLLGRVLMPDVSPAWRVYERGTHTNDFYLALEVKK